MYVHIQNPQHWQPYHRVNGWGMGTASAALVALAALPGLPAPNSCKQ